MAFPHGAEEKLATALGDKDLAHQIMVVLKACSGAKTSDQATGKIGFFDGVPVVKASAYTQTYSTATRTHNNDTSANMPAGGVGTAAGGWDTAANRDTAITNFNALRVDLDNLKQLVNSVIDDLQAYGLFP